MAGRWNLIVNQEAPQPADAERVERMMQTFSLEAEKIGQGQNHLESGIATAG
jgi:hypothetical protein